MPNWLRICIIHQIIGLREGYLSKRGGGVSTFAWNTVFVGFKSDGFFKKLYSTEENQISKRNSLFDNQCNYLYSWLIYSVPTRILLTLWRDKSSSIAPLEACNINVQAVLFYTFFCLFSQNYFISYNSGTEWNTILYYFFS